MNGSGTSRDLNQRMSTGLTSARRRCTGGCGFMRSIAQFKGDSTVYIRCARRTAKEK